jgi:hypothetical protein
MAADGHRASRAIFRVRVAGDELPQSVPRILDVLCVDLIARDHDIAEWRLAVRGSEAIGRTSDRRGKNTRSDRRHDQSRDSHSTSKRGARIHFTIIRERAASRYGGLSPADDV